MFDPVHVPANYALLIENLMDITHFYPLHDGNIGDIEQSKIPVELVEETLRGNAHGEDGPPRAGLQAAARSWSTGRVSRSWTAGIRTT